MSLRFCSLGSSSSGNCYFIESNGGTRILVDAGIPLRRLERRLSQLNIHPASIQGVFLTHAHRDHVASYLIKHPFATRYGLHSYATTPTWHALLACGCGQLNHDRCHRLEAGESVTVGDLRVAALAKPHDAAGAVCYRISTADVSLAVVTDLGYLPPELLQALRGCHYYVFEANHDVALERQSQRPWSLKQRVLGDYGHLSNEQAAESLAQLATEAKGIYLAHLSEECNLPDLATLVVREHLHRAGLNVTVVHLPTRGVSPFFGEPRQAVQLALVGEED
ncbi:MAG: MBL fold metallo-hydrolase [Bacillota bacterium]|jgi:phosphoribosyl 1,2-cyclic phosphodiesterase